MVQIFIVVRGFFCLQQDEYEKKKGNKKREILVLLEYSVSSSLLFVNI